MNFDVVLSLEAVEDVLRIAMASESKAAVVNASKQIQEGLRSDPADAGEHLSEGLYFMDREPLRAFFTMDVDVMLVEIVNVKQVRFTRITTAITGRPSQAFQLYTRYRSLRFTALFVGISATTTAQSTATFRGGEYTGRKTS